MQHCRHMPLAEVYLCMDQGQAKAASHYRSVLQKTKLGRVQTWDLIATSQLELEKRARYRHKAGESDEHLG